MKIKHIIGILVLIILIYLFRPWFHGIFMAFYTKPVLILLVIGLIGASRSFVSKKIEFGVVLSIVSFILFLLILFSPVIEQKYIVGETEYNKINELPDTTDVRILPRAVAFRYLEDSLQKSKERIGGINIVNVNNDIYWVAPRVPDGLILYLTQKVNGLMMADASKTDRSTKMISKELKIGENIGLFDNVYWNLFKKRYFVNFDDVYYVYRGDRVYTIAPIIAYKFRFPVMIPYYEGLYVLDEEGVISYYTPEEAAKEFKDNRAYPERLARLYVNSYKYNLGVFNAWFLHEDQIEISDVYGQENKQPFLMPTSSGLKWVIATEPEGESYGVFKIFLADALSGDIDIFELDEAQTLTGPVRVVSYVKKKFPRIDWSMTKIVEPRPFIINGKLYWMMSITPGDFAGITYTVFVNSENNEIVAFDNDAGVYSFVKKGVIVEEEPKEETILDKVIEIEKLLEEIKEMS